MSKLPVVRRTVVAVVCASTLAGGVAAQPQTPDPERDARAFIKTFQDAIGLKDRGQMERIVAPEFTAIDRAGTTRNRAAWVELVMSGSALTQKSVPEALSDTIAVLSGSGAVRTVTERFQDAARARDICVMTRTVFARLDGEWRVLSMQQTQLHDGPVVTTSYDGVVGKYLLDAGRPFTIARTGRTLMATLPNGSTNVPLFETPDARLLLGPGGEFVYWFDRDANGRATTVTMTRYGKQVWRATRVDGDAHAPLAAAVTTAATVQDTKKVYAPSDGVTLPIVVREVKPRYTSEAMQQQIQGSVWLRAVVLENGDVGDVNVTKSLDDRFGLDQEAIRTVKQWKFKPGVKGGKPVAVEVTIQLSFTLKQ
jgi:TonB family protein